ncbi:MAG: succinate dehydrogenase [Chloroflexi bacterium]|nr:succinate dehydrogenase [Chloroflexota bacterium]
MTQKVQKTYESVAWKWMRYSGILLIPLAWIHVLIQDVIVGVHAIDIDYVALRWANIGWQAYDFFLLAFTFAHGMNGLRQVLFDFVHGERARKAWSVALFIFWLLVSIIGTIALVKGARPELA